tara:strand:+ start:2557 stop:2742 length:186 start_codon:yes stop_codon:yes gene_type:complete
MYIMYMCNAHVVYDSESRVELPPKATTSFPFPSDYVDVPSIMLIGISSGYRCNEKKIINML